MPRLIFTLAILLACSPFGVQAVKAQQLEPRRWSHLPIGTNFGGLAYAYTGGQIALDPVLRVEDLTLDVNTIGAKYIRTFELLGKTARVDWTAGYQTGHWEGMVDGAPRGRSQNGWSDMSLRFAVNLIGSPALRGKEFTEYRAAAQEDTIVGFGLVVDFPTGIYDSTKLLNLGSNRYTFRPQFGIVRQNKKWSYELTLSSYFYTDNTNFFGRRRLERDPLYTAQVHVDYTFRPGVWVAGGLGYGEGFRGTVDGVRNDDRRENLAWSASFGYSFTKQFGIKFAYIGIAALEEVGADTHTGLTALSYMW